jgi:hypothetical protein
VEEQKMDNSVSEMLVSIQTGTPELLHQFVRADASDMQKLNDLGKRFVSAATARMPDQMTASEHSHVTSVVRDMHDFLQQPQPDAQEFLQRLAASTNQLEAINPPPAPPAQSAASFVGELGMQSGAALPQGGIALNIYPPPNPCPPNPGSKTYPYSASLQRVEVSDDNDDSSWYAYFYTPVTATGEPAPGPFPGIVFGHGKFLDYPGIYDGTLQHFCRKGAIVIFPEFEGGLSGVLSTDHLKMARRYVDGVTAASKFFGKRLDTKRLIYAGHSLGSKLASIAASQKFKKDNPGMTSYNPVELLLFSYNLAPAPFPLPPVVDPTPYLQTLPSGLEVTFVCGDQDIPEALPQAIMPYVQAIPAKNKKQLIQLQSTSATKPPLAANHTITMTAGVLPLGAFDILFASENSLDWWGPWKYLIAALEENFGNGHTDYSPYLWGQEALDGGVDSAGKQLSYMRIPVA